MTVKEASGSVDERALASRGVEADLQTVLGQLLVDKRMAELFVDDPIQAVDWAVEVRGMRSPGSAAQMLLRSWCPSSASELAALIDATFGSGPMPTWPARRMVS